MRLRIIPALGLVLAVLAAPIAGALCETRCAGDMPAASAAPEPGSCHREAPADEGVSLAAGHGCLQHAALPAVPAVPVMKTDAGRGLVKHTAAATAIASSALVAHAAARPPLALDTAGPPVPGARQHAPLRI